MLKLTEINGLIEYANSIKEDLICNYGCVVDVTGKYTNNGYTIKIRLFDNSYKLYNEYSTGIHNNYIEYVKTLQGLEQRIIKECF